MFIPIAGSALTAIVIAFLINLILSPPASAARWKICGIAPRITCTTACSQVIASFPTYEQCAAAKKTMHFPSSKTGISGRSAGGAGLAECRKRYGKTVSDAMLSKDGKTLICYHAAPNSDDPLVMRDACKKRWGPMSQIRRHRGKWYCTA